MKGFFKQPPISTNQNSINTNKRNLDTNENIDVPSLKKESIWKYKDSFIEFSFIIFN
jgi:hypothetical protein